MTLYRDEGVVLRTQKLGEADRIITLLTKRGGRVRAVAKGIRRTKSKFGSRLEPMNRVDLQLFTKPTRALDIVTQAELLDSFADPISSSYSDFTAGVAMLETTERITAEEKVPALRLYLLLCGALRVLAARAHPGSLVLDSFILRALASQGYQPTLSDCAGCGAAGPHRWFSVAQGGAVCRECRAAGAATVGQRSLELMSALLVGDWTVAEASQTLSRHEVSGLTAAYLQWNLERKVRSLALVER